jgi:hypothetical protein
MLAGLGLSGCYPSFLTSQPEARIVVTDEAGTPLEGVTVTLGTMEWHGIVGRNTRQDFVTDHEGKVEIDDEHVWAMQILPKPSFAPLKIAAENGRRSE